MKKLSLFLVVVLTLTLCACAHTHAYTDTVVDPTCTEDGYTKHTCECGDEYQDTKVPAAHKEEVLAAKDATCTEDGLTEGKKCSACGETLVAQQTVAAKGHQYGDWTIVQDATYTETGVQEKECSVCGDKVTEDIPVKEDPGPFDIVFDFNGEDSVGGYATIEQLGDAFLADFNKYAGASVSKENFQGETSSAVKVALSNPEMLAKWNWLWVYMQANLQELNPDATSEYLTDIYPMLEKLINGDTTAISAGSDEGGPNARTAIRSYIHGLLNLQQGEPVAYPAYAEFMPNFSSAEQQQKLLKAQYGENNYVGGYDSIEDLGNDFLADFNKYAGASVSKENFQGETSSAVKVALSNPEMLAKWNWLWVYMRAHLQQLNPDATSAYITDIYPMLEKLINGDTTAISAGSDEGGPNARTAIRSYIHGMLNSQQGEPETYPAYAKFMPDFSVAEVQENLMKYDVAVTLEKGTELITPVRNGYTFTGWKNANGDIVTTAAANGTLTATWEAVTQ